MPDSPKFELEWEEQVFVNNEKVFLYSEQENIRAEVGNRH